MPTWSSYLRTFIITALVSSGLVYSFIVLVDPYDNVPFSLPLEREPISTNQRFAYPSLARKPEFDSAIIGTSTARLLKPERLNKLTGDNWVNLAMNSATAYEQMEMLKLFLRHHPKAKNIVIGIDDAWCRPGTELQKFTFRPFPPWMYDENRWNDLLYLFNDKALENAVRLIEYWLGKREAKYDRTGYRDFTEDFGERNSTLNAPILRSEGLLRPNALEAIDNQESVFAAHELLATMLYQRSLVPTVTLLFMPMHGAYLFQGGVNYQYCKGSIKQLIRKVKDVGIIDRMRIDPLTTNDSHYWDSLHFGTEVALDLEKNIAKQLF